VIKLNFAYLVTGLFVGAIIMATAGTRYRVHLQARLNKLKEENATLLSALKALSTPRVPLVNKREVADRPAASLLREPETRKPLLH
jgi:hypothetical protein